MRLIKLAGYASVPERRLNAAYRIASYGMVDSSDFNFVMTMRCGDGGRERRRAQLTVASSFAKFGVHARVSTNITALILKLRDLTASRLMVLASVPNYRRC